MHAAKYSSKKYSNIGYTCDFQFLSIFYTEKERNAMKI